MALALPELVLRADLDVREWLRLVELDAVARAEYEQLEEEGRSSTTRCLR